MTDDAEPTAPSTPEPQPREQGLDVEAEQERLDDLGRKITEVRAQAEKDMPQSGGQIDLGGEEAAAGEQDDSTEKQTDRPPDTDSASDRDDEGDCQGADDDDEHADRSDEHAEDTDAEVEPDIDR